MADFVLMAHSGWRYIVLIMLVITLVKMLVGWLGKARWTRLDGRLLSALRVVVNIQVVLGLLLYILLQFWTNMRFTGEHVVVALLAVSGVEFAAARAKRAAADNSKFKWAAIGLIVAFVLIFVALRIVGGLFGSIS
ncbi:MAG: hypothetical protein FOGNACKC_03395 [Anaerolineae bacterium]|nr:hypothetical protein [Anaerolineae bacterium]